MSEEKTLEKMKLVSLVEKSSLSNKAKDEIYKTVLGIKGAESFKKGGKVKAPAKKMMYGGKAKKKK